MSNCKICLCSKPRKDVTELCIFDNGIEQSYNNIMLFCLGIKIEENNSSISGKLCVKCFRKIIDFYHFKSLAVKNYEKLISTEKDTDFTDVEVKKEELSDSEHEGQDGQDEPLIHIDENDFNIDQNIIIETKEEYKQEVHSDDEFLSVVSQVKSSLSLVSVKSNSVDETEGNEPIKKKTENRKKGRPKMQKELKKVRELKKCEKCGKEVVALKAHMLRHMPLELRKKVKCDLCDKVFTTKNLMQRHIKSKHFNMNAKKKCPVCDKLVANLWAHSKTMHERDTLRHLCVYCNLRFLTKTALKSHLAIHIKDRPFHCNLCPSKFKLQLSLNNHRREVHEKEKSHLCQFCSKSFFKKDHLQIHIRSHTNEKPCQCQECGKRFQSKKTLRAHKLLHNKDKKFNCTLCESSFVTKAYLRAHLLSHTKEKRYPCHYCPVKFHRSDHRKNHEFSAHLKHCVGNT